MAFTNDRYRFRQYNRRNRLEINHSKINARLDLTDLVMGQESIYHQNR